ncbi:HDL250Cp [Eremothecium sinecaudum]|uniref:HDL250Cp n=1 Tax=Eremothecium sinecaudum TaxID=45286 RepID=A0A0X8HS80_9SACH|nr:HDL250Cp [Eremothecium sinecaudum]AMD20494.1 HDL250Cp [Eremothecium sinecaudum]
MKALTLSYIIITSAAIVAAEYVEPYRAHPTTQCSEDSHCPVEWPCCSQYGECGSGPLCIVGCNPKFSFSVNSCIPSPALLPKMLKKNSNGVQALSAKGDPSLLTTFKVKESYEFTTHHEEQADYISQNEKDLNKRGLIHFPDFLITSKESVARQMLEQYDFTHSGFASIDPVNNDLILGMPKKSTGSLITSTKSFLYGRAAVTLKTSRGVGVVTAIVLMSSSQDEIDFEFLGGELNMVQTNYYHQGVLDHHKMEKHHISSDSFEEFHIYEVDWDNERILWLVDGVVVRTVYKRDTWDPAKRVYRYPQTPMSLQVSVWPAGTPESAEGTVQWAGGLVDWDNLPDIKEKGQLYATVRRISITPYENKFWPALVQSSYANALAGEAGNLKKPHISYAYAPSAGFFDESSLKMYVNAVSHLAKWTSTGLNPHR